MWSIRRPPAAKLLYAVVLAAVSWMLLAWVAARFLVVRAEIARADALVVLGGSSAYQERTKLAAQLWYDKRAPRIVLTNDSLVSGWSSAEERNPLFVERAERNLENAGVPSDRIEVVPETVSGTYDEAVKLRAYAAAHGLHSILVVTSAYHSRRALWTFRTVFRGTGVAVGLEAAPAGEQSPPAATWWLRSSGWRMVALEYPKLIYYKLVFH